MALARGEMHKMDEVLDITVHVQRAFPFSFCSSSLALIHSAEHSIKVISLANGLRHCFYACNWPKSNQQGPTVSYTHRRGGKKIWGSQKYHPSSYVTKIAKNI